LLSHCCYGPFLFFESRIINPRCKPFCGDSQTGVDKLISKLHSWQMTAVASAILLGLWAPAAQALSLGQINVKSTLGEPLVAEIDILDINPDEAATMVARVASPDAFKASGLDYNAAISGLRATLSHRANGKPYIRLTGDKPVNDPFVDMILEASWNTGRIVRDYTMLFDPPSFRATSPAASAPAAALAQTPKAPSGVTTTAKPVTPAMSAKAAKAEPSPAVKKEAGASAAQQVTVKPGETASHLAGVYRPVNVSLDQMLVALLRTNPDAFVNNNVNRLKAGSLVDLPSEAQAAETPAAQATQMIVAQSQDFNSFRRSLASSASSADVAPAKREASGKVQASVDDKKTPLVSPDKLTLSKGNLPGTSNAEQVAQARNAKDAADRAAELAKNLHDLSKIAAASSAAIGSAAPTAPATSAAPVAAASAPASAAVTVASSTPVTPAITAQAPAKPLPKAPEPVAEPSFLEGLFDNPTLPLGAAGLIALLAGLGIYRAKQRKKSGGQDSIFADSKLQPESFFGGTGGRNVNTNDGGVAGSSMMYSPSQLDAVDDVDPVAEADVYLAYGRDLQAEEILKDALRTTPDRLAIQQKLLEIYAKRRDAKAFESIATLSFNLTNGTGPDWERICEKGLALEPDNALYLPGGQPLAEFKTTLNATDIATQPSALAEEPAAPAPAKTNTIQELDNLDLDLDLDFSLDEPQLTEHTGAGELGDLAETPRGLPTEMSLDTTTISNEVAAPAMDDALPTLPLNDMSDSTPPQTPEFDSDADLDLDFDLGLEDPASRPAPLDTPAKTETATLAADFHGETGPMSLDLGDLSLDFASTGAGGLPSLSDALAHSAAEPEALDNPATEPGGYSDVDGDPLETKLALADEFKAIGDEDGARALIEEVMAESSGEVRERAERALKKL
jgi:pilus assembly protein FimV